MSRLEVLKTYKIYIGGQFPRTESGRYYEPLGSTGKKLGNICLSSRKDLRNAVVAARKAGAWAERTAFNRSQVLYRIAEMLETRRGQFLEELEIQGSTKQQANKELDLSIDRLVYYAGWCDKYQQVMSSVNPVASSHFNFSACEPMGVVGIIAEQSTSLIGLISVLAPVIAGGNCAVVVASEEKPLSAITFAEVLHSSDVPAGVVNILTGKVTELLDPMSKHMDINAVIYCGNDQETIKDLEINAVENLKRVRLYNENWAENTSQGLHYIADFQEIKTTWHPIENIGGASSTY